MRGREVWVCYNASPQGAALQKYLDRHGDALRLLECPWLPLALGEQGTAPAQRVRATPPLCPAKAPNPA